MNVYYREVDCNLGLGVFAARAFKKGELVLQPTGRVISYQTIYSIQFDWDCHLDPDAPAKYLNHSCDPNLGIHTCPNGWPEFVALRDIVESETFQRGRTPLRFALGQDVAGPHLVAARVAAELDGVGSGRGDASADTPHLESHPDRPSGPRPWSDSP